MDPTIRRELRHQKLFFHLRGGMREWQVQDTIFITYHVSVDPRPSVTATMGILQMWSKI